MCIKNKYSLHENYEFDVTSNPLIPIKDIKTIKIFGIRIHNFFTDKQHTEDFNQSIPN